MKKFQAKRLMALDKLMLNFDFDNYVFNINYWIDNNIWYKPTTKDVRITKNHCGTACCAAGHGILQIPSWKRHLKLERGSIGYKDKEICAEHGRGKRILSNFLGITPNDAHYIFYSENYTYVPIRPRDVSIHIRKVLQDYGYEINS